MTGKDDSFLFTVLMAIFENKGKTTINYDPDKEQLFVNGQKFSLPDNELIRVGLQDRINLVAKELGVQELTVPDAALFLRSFFKSKNSVSPEEIISLLQSTSLRKNDEKDSITKWRQALEMRVRKAAIGQPRCEWLSEAPEEKRDEYLESGPLLEKWPLRLLENESWACTERVFDDIEPFPLDEIWTDLYLVNPDEPWKLLETPSEGSFIDLLDSRYEKKQWFSQPAGFVMEQLLGTIAVIGTPGSGKTTMLKWLARQLIFNPDGKFLLPLYVPLRLYTLVLQSPDRNRTGIVDYALEYAGINSIRQRELWSLFLTKLAGGQRDNVLFLLDGWDEVPDGERALLGKELEELAHEFSYLITSRPSAYPKRLPTDSFYEISELPWESIYQLINQWFKVIKKASLAKSVLEHLNKYPDLKRMARNPFLLTLICALAFYKAPSTAQEIPRTRTELYREAVRIIIEQHNARNSKDPFNGTDCPLVERLAFWLFKEAPNAPRYIFELSDFMGIGGSKRYIEKTLKPARLITRLAQKGESFHFIHPTFQEFFAACYIARKKIPEVEQLFSEIAYDPSWQEILSFTAGQVQNSKLIENLFWRRMKHLAATPDRYGFIYLQLARYVAEAGAVDGGNQLLGVDLREKLWQFVISREKNKHYVDALVSLDAHWYIERVREYLKQPDIPPRLNAVLIRTLKHVKTADSSDELVRQILGEREDSSAVASYQVDQVLDDKGLQVLLKEVHNPERDIKVKVQIIHALGYSGRFEILDFLSDIARGNGDLSIPAITAIGHIGGDSAVTILKDIYKQTGKDDIRKTIIPALVNCRSLQARDTLLLLLAFTSQKLDIIQILLEELSEIPITHSFEMIFGLLKPSIPPQIRAAAAAALVNAAPGNESVAELLLQTARKDPEITVRVQALASLKKRARPVDTKDLAKIAESLDLPDGARANALHALLKTASRWRGLQDAPWLHRLAANAVRKALNQKSGTLSQEAASLSYLLDEEIAPFLMEIAGDESYSFETRENAVASLGKLKYKPAESLLLGLMNRFPDVEDDESITETDPGKRLAQRSAESMTLINPEALINYKGKTADNSLYDFAYNNGYLVFGDRIIDASGKQAGPQSEKFAPPKKARSYPNYESKKGKKKKILFLSANQFGTMRLHMDREYREIDRLLQAAKYRHLWRIIPKFAVQPDDIRQALLDHEPHIVHFSGHGSTNGVLVLDSEEGKFPETYAREALSRLFELFSGHTECIVLSACYSELLAIALARHIPYVIGMEKEIQDNAAIQFSKGFYGALGAGRSIEDAFQFGRQAILQTFPKDTRHLVPILKSEFTGSNKSQKKNKQKTRVDLFHLPAHTVSRFLGRDKDIETLVQLYGAPNCWIVSLVGFGGVGKSAVIAAFLDKIAPDFGMAEYVFGWSFYSQGSHETSVSSHEFFEEAIRFFDPRGSVPKREAERVKHLLYLLRAKPTLLILDGLEPLQEHPRIDGGRMRDRGIRWLLTDVARRGINGLVLLSSRQPFVELQHYSKIYKEIQLDNLGNNSGIELLKDIGVEGNDRQLATACEDCGGNALALVLLGKLLVSRFKNKIQQWKILPGEAFETEHGSHARRILSYYEKMWPPDSLERILLYAISLVDRPLLYEELTALRKGASFAAKLPHYGHSQFIGALHSLKCAGILTSKEEVLECHPIIRTYFSFSFESRARKEYIEAHEVLFNYFKELPSSTFPETIAEMEPLYRSIRHGCLAGKPQDALQIYKERIQRKDVYFSLYQLGAFDTDLSALASFFPNGWISEPVRGISSQQANDILSTAVYCLLSLTRMEEAINVLKKNLKWALGVEDWLSASTLYEHLVEILTQCGRLSEAGEIANEALENLPLDFTQGEMIEARADAAYVKLYQGKIDEACEDFRLIEMGLPHDKQPIKGYAGYQYCEALIAKGDRKSIHEVIERAKVGIKYAHSENRLLHLSLFELALGRAQLIIGKWEEGLKSFQLSEKYAWDSGSEETWAFVLAVAGNALLGYHATAADLDQASSWLHGAATIIDKRNLPLVEIEVKLGFSKLSLLSGDHNESISKYQESLTLIEQTGYFLAHHTHRFLGDELSRIKS
jgi:tetratricopeptide (TPR) repeat protein